MNSEDCFYCKNSKWVQKFSKIHFLSLFKWNFDFFPYWNSIFKFIVTVFPRCSISSYSFRGKILFFNLKIQRSQYIRPKVTVYKCAETIQEINYSRAETIWGNTVYAYWISCNWNFKIMKWWGIHKIEAWNRITKFGDSL